MPTLLRHPNQAHDKDLRDEVKRLVIPQVKDTRRDRRTMRETWLRYHRIWSATRDQEAYQGREALYFAKGRKLIDNWVRRLKRDLFPSDDWFDVTALRASYAERESPTHAILNYFARHDADIRRNSSPFLRQLVTLGTSPVKIIWQQEEETLDVYRELLDPDGNPTRKAEKAHEIVIRKLGPSFTPVDLFSWYVAPVTVRDPEDALLCFEDLLIPRGRVNGRGEQWISPSDHSLGTVYDKEAVDEIASRMEGGGQTERTQEKWDAERRRLADKGFTQGLIQDLKMPTEFRQVDLTQVIWKRCDPDTGETLRYLVDLALDDIILRIQQVPWMHGLPHIVAGKFVEVVSEFYGRGLPEIFDRMQYTLNDTGNQALDALTYAVNPITVVDLYQVQDPTSLRFRPGAKWLAAPGSVKTFEMSPEPAVVGLNAVGTLMSVMTELADVVPVGGSQPRGRGQKSAAGMQMAVSEAQVDIRDVVEQIEDQVMNPWLERGHSMAIQYLEEPLVLRINGKGTQQIIEQKIDRVDLLGDFRFQWLGSSASLNTQVRSQQMIQAFQMATQVPPEALAAEGKRISLATILHDIFSKGLQLPDADRYIVDIHPSEGTDPTLENDLFRVGRGREVIVSEADDDDKHMAEHLRLAQHAVEADVEPADMALLQKHIRLHQSAKMAKQIMAQQQQQQQAMAQAQGGGNGAKPNGQAGAPMNPGRPPSTTDISDVFRQAGRGQG